MTVIKQTSIFGCVLLLALVCGCAADLEHSSDKSGSGGSIDKSPNGVFSIESDDDSSAKTAKVAGREIIYTASVRLVADDFDTFPERLAQIAIEAEGFIGEADIAKMQGKRRSGSWVIRVPSTKYATFMRAVIGLGVPESVKEKANDVTDKFIDLQARIKSGKQLEEQIIKLLERQGGQLEDILTVERELARVRMEIEQKEGQIRFLENQVALSTISVYASEPTTFTPEQTKPFSQRITGEWQASLLRARTTFEEIAVWFAANGIILVGWLIGLCLAWTLFIRRLWKLLGRQQ